MQTELSNEINLAFDFALQCSQPAVAKNGQNIYA